MPTGSTAIRCRMYVPLSSLFLSLENPHAHTSHGSSPPLSTQPAPRAKSSQQGLLASRPPPYIQLYQDSIPTSPSLGSRMALTLANTILRESQPDRFFPSRYWSREIREHERGLKTSA